MKRFLQFIFLIFGLSCMLQCHQNKKESDHLSASVIEKIALPNMVLDVDNFGVSGITNRQRLSNSEIEKLHLQQISNPERNEYYPEIDFYLLHEIDSVENGKILLISGIYEMENFAWLVSYDISGKVIDYRTVFYDEFAESIAQITSVFKNDEIQIKTYKMDLETEDETVTYQTFSINSSLKFILQTDDLHDAPKDLEDNDFSDENSVSLPFFDAFYASLQSGELEEKIFIDEFSTIDRTRGWSVFGDINGDKIIDGLLSFMVAGTGGGNNWTYHYAVFLGKKNGSPELVSIYHRGGWASAYTTVFTKIENEKIIGYLTPNTDWKSQQDIVPTTFIYKENDLLQTFIQLHIPEGEKQNVFYIDNLLTADNREIPTSASVAEYQSLFGKSKIEFPEEEPEECGPYYEYSEFAGFLEYPNLLLEVNKMKEAAIVQIQPQNSGFKIQTNVGTLTEKTTLEEFLKLFPDDISMEKTDFYSIFDIRIPTKPDGKDYWIIFFDMEKKTIKYMELFIGCI